jgi:hypothetical protein
VTSVHDDLPYTGSAGERGKRGAVRAGQHDARRDPRLRELFGLQLRFGRLVAGRADFRKPLVVFTLPLET